jgi:predicted enzyme related to lactoylglutathione lyase
MNHRANEVLMGQPVVHWEFWSEDPARIADFHQKVFAWNISAIPELNYRLVETGEQEEYSACGSKCSAADPVPNSGILCALSSCFW